MSIIVLLILIFKTQVTCSGISANKIQLINYFVTTNYLINSDQFRKKSEILKLVFSYIALLKYDTEKLKIYL